MYLFIVFNLFFGVGHFFVPVMVIIGTSHRQHSFINTKTVEPLITDTLINEHLQ
jgi:hypothetical protein